MNRRFDSGLRALHLELLDRDFELARRGVLGVVVPVTDWQRVRRNWHYPPNMSISIVVHDVPMAHGCGTHRLPPAFPPPGAGAPIGVMHR